MEAYAVRPCIKQPRWSPVIIVLGSVLIALIVAMAILIDLEQFTPSNSTKVENQTEAEMFVMPETTEAADVSTAEPTKPPPPEPPTIAKARGACDVPAGLENRTTVESLCWLDEHHLIAALHDGQQVVSLNIQNGGCTANILDSGYKAGNLACSSDGTVYVVDRTNYGVRRINPDGTKDTWTVDGVLRPQTVATAGDRIIIASKGKVPVSVFNTNQDLIRKMTIDNNKHKIDVSHLSQNGELFVGTSLRTRQLIIHNTTNDASVAVGSQGEQPGQFNYPAGVGTVPGDSILVCDRVNDHISVFAPDGAFLHYLDWGSGKVTYPNAMSILVRKRKPSIMALTSGEDGLISLYTLS